jgi:hypothetical protein
MAWMHSAMPSAIKTSVDRGRGALGIGFLIGAQAASLAVSLSLSSGNVPYSCPIGPAVGLSTTLKTLSSEEHVSVHAAARDNGSIVDGQHLLVYQFMNAVACSYAQASLDDCKFANVALSDQKLMAQLDCRGLSCGIRSS